jgi:nucleotide sugar dehydrogenase
MNLLEFNPEQGGEALKQGRISVCVVGLGRIGLPTAVIFALAGAEVLGADIDAEVVSTVNSGSSKFVDEPGLNDLLRKVVASHKLTATTDVGHAVNLSDLIIICVPTPIDLTKSPDYSHVIAASRTVGKSLRRGSIVVIESTVGPGTIENQIRSTLEAESGMKAGLDFGLASCPERSDPGSILKNMKSVPRVIGAMDARSAEILASIYSAALGAEVIRVSDPKTANAVKLTENLFRDVNIALANEFAILFEKLGIDSVEVINACSSKYNFMPHYPGSGVGGPCLPSNSYYLIAEGLKVGNIPYLIRMAREINDRMPDHVIDLVLQSLNDVGKTAKGARVALLGLSYKPEIKDTQLTPAERIYNGLIQLGAEVEVYDPYFCGEVVFGKLVHGSLRETVEQADCLVICTAHREFKNMDLGEVARLVRKPACLVDTRHVVDPKMATEVGLAYRGVGRLVRQPTDSGPRESASIEYLEGR